MKNIILIMTSVLFISSCDLDFDLYNYMTFKVVKWDNGIIYYHIIQEDFPDVERQRIKDCMSRIEKDTIIKFVEVPTIEELENYNYVCIIYTGENDQSMIGQSLISYVRLRPQCYVKTIYHELGHVIGLTHEQQRPDRDEYIKIHWENLLGEKRLNYVKFNNSLFDETLFDYDYASIMHYPARACTKNNKDVIEVIDKNYEIAYSKYLSEIDIQKINFIYSK